MTFARWFARVQTVVIVTLFYFLIISPIGFVLTLCGWDPLDRRGFRRSAGDERALSNWQPIKKSRDDRESLERMS